MSMSYTTLAVLLRKQWSDEHLFEATAFSPACGRCGKRERHPHHVTRERDRAEVSRWADRISEERGDE